RPAAVRVPPAALQPVRPRPVRGGAGAVVRQGASGRHPLLLPGRRVPDGQVPLRGGPRAEPARGQGEGLPQRPGYRILQALDDVAARYQATPARVALAWLLARPSVTAPIASATSLTQFKDLVEATRLELDATAIRQLNEASA